MTISAEPISPEAIDAGLRFLGNVAKTGATSNESAAKVIRFAMSPSHQLREASIPALVQLTGRAAQLAVVGLIKDTNPAIQIDAAATAGKLQIEDAVPALIEVLDTKNDELALRAAAALGRMGNRQGLHAVLQILKHDGEHTCLAALALGLITGQRFRLNQQGVKQARLYAKRQQLHKET